MDDIKQRLRDWIERSAEPVTANESIRRATDREGERSGRRRWTAAVAGAAFIMILVGLPTFLLQPDPGSGNGPTGSPTTTATTVPSWEGRSIEDVRAEADRLGLDLMEEPIHTGEVPPGEVIRQSPGPGEPIREDNRVVVAVAVPLEEQTTTTAGPPTTTCDLPERQPQGGERYVSVFYGCETNAERRVQPVLRAVPSDTRDLIHAAFAALASGPTTAERDSGIKSGFGADTSGVVQSVSFESGDLQVDLDPSITEANVQGRDVTALFATGFQFETTARIEVTIDGSCEAFSEWSGRECSVDAETWWHDARARELMAGWPRVVARPAPVTGDCDMSPALPGTGEMEVTILYSCRTGEDSLLDLTTVIRLVPADSDPILATLEEVVKGPNGKELAAGLSGSFLSERTAYMVRSVDLEGSRLIVDFHPFVRSPEISNITTSTGGLVFNTMLNANLFQFPEVDEIEYRVDGECSAYWAVFEANCSIQTREAHERAIEELS